ncbi:hypothetical protein PENNAL_c0022G00841 [Penicillium nalgiovense]|uniref:GED domain-containing protein n=1 Tax=Penicillium nalgiovense TaxID=60175 RepID=A0A1V6YFT8_PENNA|nr:hypothetical protein PENNAL_c0022G00841 [Penicillium nalgiovense]
MSSLLDEKAMDQLQSQQSELLDKIDELRAIGVGGLVELPQIVVCGSQSSGKSSVLEAISRVRFPTKSNLCTRFATEFVLRRASEIRIKVSIDPGDSRSDVEEQQKLQAFSSEERDMSPETFSSSAKFKTLIDRARECMGLSSVNSEFSDDVLKIEISGPEQPELTLVDLPGLYYSTSSEQSAEGKALVERLTERYMKRSRSIILAVISAKNDYHNQNILNIAQRFDPNYERVLGIVTQPDTAEAGSEQEETYLQFIQNKKVKLQLGWHVLRNRSFEKRNISDDARDAQEKSFFENGKWASLSRNQVGIEALRTRLSKILLRHISRNLPGLIMDIQERILRNEKALRKLGDPRATVQDQRQFLVGISSRFARIINQALNGSYTDDFFGGFKEGIANTDEFYFRRLRAVIRELNEHFAEAMSIGGCRRMIVFDGLQVPGVDIELERSKPYMHDWTPKYVLQSTLEEEIKEQALKSRGIELPGSANPLLVGSLFRDQCEPWETIAESHVLNAWESVQYFVQLVLKYLTDDHTRPLLFRHLIGPELEKMKDSLFEKLSELVSYSKSGHPLPVGETFLSKVLKSRTNRQVAMLKRNLGLTGLFFGDNNQKSFSASDLERAASQLQSSSDQFATAEIIDQMQAYYETAIITFIDNVTILAIENRLLCTLEHIFTSRTVVGMDDHQIEEIAAEPLSIQAERKRLNEELNKLRKAKRTLNAFSVDEQSLRSPPTLAQTIHRGLTHTSAPKPEDVRPAVASSASGVKSNKQAASFSHGGSAEKFQQRPSIGLFGQPTTGTPLNLFGPPQTRNDSHRNGSQFGGNGTSSQNGQVSGSSSSPLGSSIHSTPTKNQNHHFDAAKLPTTFGPALG